MTTEWLTLADGVLLRAGTPWPPDTWIFDIDGVLVDVSGSFSHVISRVVEEEMARLHPGEPVAFPPQWSRLFKAAGGFNDDWELAQGAVLFLLADTLCDTLPPLPGFLARLSPGGGLPALRQALEEHLGPRRSLQLAETFRPERIVLRCQQVYGGPRAPLLYGTPADPTESGLMFAETLQWQGLPPQRTGIYTGRSRTEAAVVLERLGWDLPETVCLTADGPYRKPDEEALRVLGRRLGTGLGVFLGDSRDDLETVRRYRQRGDGPPFLFAGVLGGALGEQAEAIFREGNADLLIARPEVLGWFLQASR